MTKTQADIESFSALDMRIGTITNVEMSNTRKPTYRIYVDFGPEIGEKTSCGAYRNYEASYLLGKQIVAIINFPSMKMGTEISEILILGVANNSGDGTTFLTVDSPSENGSIIF